MALADRHLVSIDDFTNEEIESVLDMADQMNTALENRERLRLCEGKELYTIFYESSTRTRSSFETAMHRLGGTVVSHAEAQTTSSVAKGENIADTVRVVEKYADIIVMRHPIDGSTRLAAEHSSIPIISGGDGAHEHPTQTLLDIYTIRKERGSIKGKNVALCGDLRHGRTVHSLALALARLGVKITCIAPEGFELPAHIRDALKNYNCKLTEYKSLEGESSSLVHESKAGRRHQEGFMDFLLENLDVLYFTRLQRERFTRREATDVDQESYRMNKQLLTKSRGDVVIMHPLPRVNELAYEVDRDKRAAYFRQAGYGVPVRMALIALLLGVTELEGREKTRKGVSKTPEQIPGIRCPNEHCVTNVETYAIPKFYRNPRNKHALTCYYCDWPVESKV